MISGTGRRFVVSTLLAALLVGAGQVRAEDNVWLDQGEHLKEVTLGAQAPLALEGWTRQGRGDVYRLPVKAGQTLRITLKTSSEFVFMAIFDLAHPDDDALFFSDSGGKSAVLTAKTDTQWLIRPTLVLGSPRRGWGANYTVTIEHQ
jgi:hypothetical protein